MRTPETILAVFMLAAAACLLDGCSTLPSLDNRSTSQALSETDDTEIGSAISAQLAAHPGEAGIYPLFDAQDAFAARVLLTQAAERSLDVQYYIWHQDMSGTLLLKKLYEAADRGVRVRLLLDDNNTRGMDTTLAALDAHPNIEVRLFNPFATRSPRWIGYLTDFSRLNRRMHNKSFTADNQVTIIGGRNIGDEYFGATDGIVFVDLDVMAVGPVVKEVSDDFDRYWSSASSYPVDGILPHTDASQLAELATKATAIEQDPAARAYMEAIEDSDFVHDLVDSRLQLEWSATQMVSDDPAKGLERDKGEASITHQLERIIGKPQKSLDLVSAYFVPTKSGVEALTELARKGVKIRILTNSLEATDVSVVHAGYAKWRKELLQSGITLYELRRQPSSTNKKKKGSRKFGRSGASLHAKTFSVDNSFVYIGSFNFDPRSARLNTELGFVIENPRLAQDISNAFDERITNESYEVHLTETGELYWTEMRDGKTIRHDTEPGTGFWKRTGIGILSLLPFEWML